MSATTINAPAVTPADRLGLTLCLAVIAHAVFILGITFATEDPAKPLYDTMEIILVQRSEPEAPEDARLLAQANLEGGGETAEESPATPLPAPFPDQQAQVALPPPVEAPPVTMEREVVEPPVEAETPPPTEQLLAAEAPAPEKVTEAEPVTEQAGAQAAPPRPSAAQLLTNSFRIASLSAEIKRKLEAQSQRPRRKFISASTREYKYASYMEAWRAKVERVGNLNYPEEARRRKLSGSLILDVALNADGSVNQITIRHSSGESTLDDAAVRIVNLAAPFAPFPDAIRAETDILHITRTWQFINNQGFH